MYKYKLNKIIFYFMNYEQIYQRLKSDMSIMFEDMYFKIHKDFEQLILALDKRYESKASAVYDTNDREQRSQNEQQGKQINMEVIKPALNQMESQKQDKGPFVQKQEFKSQIRGEQSQQDNKQEQRHKDKRQKTSEYVPKSKKEPSVQQEQLTDDKNLQSQQSEAKQHEKNDDFQLEFDRDENNQKKQETQDCKKKGYKGFNKRQDNYNQQEHNRRSIQNRHEDGEEVQSLANNQDRLNPHSQQRPQEYRPIELREGQTRRRGKKL